MSQQTLDLESLRGSGLFLLDYRIYLSCTQDVRCKFLDIEKATLVTAVLTVVQAVYIAA